MSNRLFIAGIVCATAAVIASIIGYITFALVCCSVTTVIYFEGV